MANRKGSKLIDADRHDASSVNITSASSVELIAATSDEISAISVSNAATSDLQLKIENGGSEETLMYVPASSNFEQINVWIPKGVSVHAQSLSGSDITSGILIVNLWG